MTEPETQDSRIKELMEKGERSLSAAHTLFEKEHYDFAVSRAYYAMFYFTEALLLTKGLEFSKHSAVIGAFHKQFVKTGILPKSAGTSLTKAFESRAAGDYDTSFPSKEAAWAVIENAGNFIEMISRTIQKT